MKQYTKEEISALVGEISQNIMEENSTKFSSNVVKMAEGKTDTELIIQMFASMYFEVQKNCETTITEVLNKILNDQ